MANEDRLRELEEKYEDYKVYDNQGERIGKVDDLFVDETDREEYIGVKMGFLGLKSTLIPMDIVRVNEGERTIEVSDSKDHVRNAPSFDDDEDITPDFEDRIRSHFGLESVGTSSRGAYSGASSGDYADRDRAPQDNEAEDDSTDYDDRASADPEYGERMESAERGEDSRDATGYAGESPEGRSSIGSTGPFADETSREAPTTRQTEETIQEGGRTKIRRRVIREEIIEDDPQSQNN
ncbi:MAG TPA: PRC-barrel domain-containing protein [Rubrobacter sp.]|nr:PRC-barrel domain-containing protein [Rubrobacter sp.]HKH58678.1 PRC-barrel domain-containing protein [Rubrobacter sp.]